MEGHPVKKGICSTCKHYSRGCKLNVVDRSRGSRTPCGWWEARRRVRRNK